MHIWGDDGTACTGTDQCDDTPNQAGPNETIFGICPAFPHISCTNGPNGDMFMNYMDYSVDGCKNIFTQGQTNRMRAMFAQGGPRAAFINNYFRVNERTEPICTSGNVTAQNLSCLRITWSVVSGPATIIGGQNTNTVTLQQTGNGIAVIRATAGGYIDEKNITIGTGTNAINFTQKDITCEVGPYFFGAVAAVPSATNYAWYSKDESNPSNPFVLKQSGNSNTADFPLGYNSGEQYYTIRVVATNPCGSFQSIDEDGYIFAPDCSGGGLKIMISPNPTSSTISVQVVDELGKPSANPNKKFYELQLTDKFGTVLRHQKYTNGTNQAAINLNDLRAELYYLRVWDGKKWTTKSVLKK